MNWIYFLVHANMNSTLQLFV